MKQKKRIIEFMNMNSNKFGGLERFNIELSKQLRNTKFCPIFIYNSQPTVSEYCKKLTENDAIIETLPLGNTLNYIANIYKIFKKYKPTIIHCHFDNRHSFLIFFIASLFGIKKRYKTYHGMQAQKNLKTVIGLKMLSYFTTMSFTVSDGIKKQLIENYGFNLKKTDTLRLGVRFDDEEKKNPLEIKKKYNIPPDKTIIGCVAFLDPIKGVDILLDAFSILTKKKKDLYLCIVGGSTCDTEYTIFLKNKTHNLDIVDNVYWMGLQNNVPELMNIFDLYCQPSRSEGISLSIMEALYSKKVIVASNVGGIPDLIINGKTGLLFEKENAAALADKLEYLLNNKNKGIELSVSGYAHVNRICNLTNQVKKLISIYQQF